MYNLHSSKSKFVFIDGSILNYLILKSKATNDEVV